MPDDKRLKLLMDVAKMHYVDKLTKTEIANKIQTSSTHVGRLLQEAESKKVVQFTFTPPRLSGLQDQLIERFPFVTEAIVVGSGDDYEFQLQALGTAAAGYFEQCVEAQAGAKIGISGGRTLRAMVQALPRRQRDITLCPTALIGLGPFMPAHIDPMVLISLLWHKSGRPEHGAYCATILPFDPGPKKRRFKELRDEYRSHCDRQKNNSKVQFVLNEMHNVDIVFASLGPIPLPAEYRRGTTVLELLKDIEVTEDVLRNAGVVGDISYEFFDRDGNAREDWDFFLALGVEHYRKMSADSRKKVVMIAGKYKVDALGALLRGKLCNVLITDSTTAEKLLMDS